MSDEGVYNQEIKRADWLIEVGQDERAMQVLTRVLAGYPDKAGNTYIELSYAHGSAGRPQDAEVAARRALALLPNDPDAHRVLAHALIDQDREAEAERPLRTALGLAPEDELLHWLMYVVMTNLDRMDEALFYAREAVRLQPNLARNHVALAQLQKDSDTAAAEASLHQALTLEPAHSGALFQLAQLRRQRRDHIGAARAIASYTAQVADPREARAAVDDFFHSTVLALHFGMLGCALLMLMSAAFLRLAELPSQLLLLPLVICAGLTFRAVGRRVRALRIAFGGRGRIMTRSFVRRQRFITAWALLLLITWVALGAGAIQLLMGGFTILAGALGVGLALLVSSWIFARFSID